MNKFSIRIVILLVVVVLFGKTMFDWTVNYVYVKQGYSLRLRYKGAPLPLLPGYSVPLATPGEFAKVDANGRPLEKGILKEMLGPGRHFVNPFWYEMTQVKDLMVNPGEVAIVKSKMGKDPPAGQFIVNGDLDNTQYKGILRRVFGPGRYRINDYAYEATIIKTDVILSQNQKKHAGWVDILPGYVGVVTNLVDSSDHKILKGIQDNTLPPGLYPINPKEQQIDIVKVGFRDLTIDANLMLTKNQLQFDDSGEPIILEDGSGISFISHDGYTIIMDFSTIWGIFPDQAADAVRKFGTIDAIENKVIIPQVESICRNMGSKLGAVELLVGDSRQEFQTKTSHEFQQLLLDKGISLLYGLVKNIHVPQKVRIPIQKSFLSEENTLTRIQEQLTAQTEANLKEEMQKVELEAQKITTETTKLYAQAIAEGDRTGQETRAETAKLVAAIDRETAVLEAQARVLLGEAESQSKKVLEQAKAAKFKLAVEAFGSGEAYNKWVFANGLPENMELNMFYSGQGTFWTDLKGFSETMLGKQQQEQQYNAVKSGSEKSTLSNPLKR
jgi:regulator of protease activity HflC (stomatin/prohibitin superfamily)